MKRKASKTDAGNHRHSILPEECTGKYTDLCRVVSFGTRRYHFSVRGIVDFNAALFHLPQHSRYLHVQNTEEATQARGER